MGPGIKMPSRGIFAAWPIDCCARAASGHVAAPPSRLMNSRRLIYPPRLRPLYRDKCYHITPCLYGAGLRSSWTGHLNYFASALRTAWGQKPEPSSALARQLSPGADMVGESGPLVKLAHVSWPHVLPAASAAFTRSGVIGYWRSRTPVASKNAFAMAAAVAPMTSSPAPVEGSSRPLTTTGITSGCSAKRNTG